MYIIVYLEQILLCKAANLHTGYTVKLIIYIEVNFSTIPCMP